MRPRVNGHDAPDGRLVLAEAGQKHLFSFFHCATIEEWAGNLETIKAEKLIER
jgi:hypothetical protein